MIFCTCRLTYPSTRTIKFSTFLYLLLNLYESGHGLKRILPSSVRSITLIYSFCLVCLFFISNCDCDIFTSLGSVTSLLFRGLSVIFPLTHTLSVILFSVVVYSNSHGVSLILSIKSLNVSLYRINISSSVFITVVFSGITCLHLSLNFSPSHDVSVPLNLFGASFCFN